MNVSLNEQWTLTSIASLCNNKVSLLPFREVEAKEQDSGDIRVLAL